MHWFDCFKCRLWKFDSWAEKMHNIAQLKSVRYWRKKTQIWSGNQRCLGLPCTILNLARLIVTSWQIDEATNCSWSETGRYPVFIWDRPQLIPDKPLPFFGLHSLAITCIIAPGLQASKPTWQGLIFQICFPVKIFSDQPDFKSSFCNSEDIFLQHCMDCMTDLI